MQKFEGDNVAVKEYTIKHSELLSPDSTLVDNLSLQAGGVALFRLYNRKYCAISNAKIAFEIQHDDEIHFGRTNFQKRIVGAVLGDSILTLDGEEWRTLRDSFNASFSKTNIAKYRDTNAAIIDREIGIEGALFRDKLELDIKWFEKLFMKIFSLDMLGALPADYKCNKILKTFAEIQQLSIACLQYPWLLLLPEWVPYPAKIMLWQKSWLLNREFTALLHSALTQRAYMPNLLNDMNNEMLRKNKCPFSYWQHFSITKSLYLSAIKTSTVTMVWMLSHLASNPTYWHRLASEIRDRFGTLMPGWGELDQIPLLRNVVNESLRITPTISLMGRQVIKPCHVAGELLSPGDFVLISTSAIHRNPLYWDNPMEFKPERFASPYNHQAFLPFQFGPHTCPGQSLARHTIYIILARLLQFYDLTPDENISFESRGKIVSSPAKPARFRLTAIS